MKSSMVKRMVACIVCIGLIYVPLTLQAQTDDYAKGEMNGMSAATGDPLVWTIAGVLFGCLATLYVILVTKPAPPPAALVGKSANYIRGYTYGFQKKTRSKNVFYSLMGWSLTLTIFFTIAGSS